MTYTELTTYFNAIATNHKEIGHTEETKRFFRMNIEEILSGSRTVTHYPFLVLENFEQRLGASALDNIQKYQTVAFMVLDKVAIDNFDAQDEVMQSTLNICEQIVAKIKKDMLDYKSRASGYTELIKDLNVNNISFNAVSNVFDNCYGYRVTFTINEQFKETYNPIHWL